MGVGDELDLVLADNDTDGVLDDVRAWLGRFLATVAESDLDLLALWAVHTHVALETYTTPRLLIDSPVPGSGKTTALEHLQRLCLAPVQMATISSPAMLARLLVNGLRTMLIDEADRSLDPKKEGIPDLLAILNSGYKRGATRPVLVPVKGGSWDVAEMPTFAPVAMAGNTPTLPEDTRSRTIRVLLLPDRNGTVEESDWELIEADAEALAGRVAAWADVIRDEVRSVRPILPEGVVGRFREKWQPLARVAAFAGGRWPASVAAMAAADVDQVEADREDGLVTDRPHVVLLRHLAEVWPVDQTFVPTAYLVSWLVDAHPAVWGLESSYGRALTVQRFGRMLATAYKVNSSRQAKDGPRGYFHAALTSVWERMGVAAPLLVDPPKRTGPTGASGATGTTSPAGSAGSAGPAGSKQTPTPEPAPTIVCRICRTRLAYDDGTGTHPTCQPEMTR
jgi:hypothetical protein